MKLPKFITKLRIPFLSQEPKPFVYVALGDSTVEGIGASDFSKTYPFLVYRALKQYRRNVQFFNLGKAGAKTEDLIQNQLQQTIQLSPDIITISIGANDIFKRKGAKHFEKNLLEIIDQLKQNTTATIVISAIPDFAAARAIPKVLKQYCRIQGKRFNAIIERATDNKRVIFVDFHLHTKIMGDRYPEIISSDGLHPSDIGYALWAQAIISSLKGVFQQQQPATSLI